MVLPFLAPFSGWGAVTSLGQSQTLLPLAVALGGWLAWRAHAGALATRWLGWLGAAAVLVVATKVAFIGWGIGSASYDFTGVSGHAMCAAAVYPLLFMACVTPSGRVWRTLALVLGCAVALLVAYSRLRIHVHSLSEVVTGCLLGGAVSWWALRDGRQVHARVPLLAVLAAIVWMLPLRVPAPAVATASTPHDLITWLALEISGHSRPYTREDLHGPATARKVLQEMAAEMPTRQMPRTPAPSSARAPDAV